MRGTTVAIDTPPEPPVQQDPAQDYKDAKAKAKAAKAYAKAQRSWYQKKRFIFSIGAIVLVVVIAALSGSPSSTTTATPTPGSANDSSATATAEATKAKTAAPPATSGATAKLPIQNGDWRLDSIRVKDDGLGDFGGTARVTYTGGNPEGGTNIFTVAVFVDGKDVAALPGSANAVMSDRAATVQLISQDKFVGARTSTTSRTTSRPAGKETNRVQRPQQARLRLKVTRTPASARGKRVASHEQRKFGRPRG